MRLRHLFFLVIVLITLQSTAVAQKFKDLHEKALAYIDDGNYADALPILLDMEKMDDKNFKTITNIGYAYLISDFDKVKSIPYFEKILENYKNLSLTYTRDSHKEKKAPVEVLHWLGNAYHYNYEFEKALMKYNEYKEVLNPNNTKYLAAVNRDIVITENAMMLKEQAVDTQIEGIAIINTPHPEYRPKISGDENIMYFTSRRPNDIRNTIDDEGLYYEDIYYSTRKFGEWSKPSLLEDEINTGAHDACLYISSDGQYMLIFRASSEIHSEGGIYETSLDGDKWSTPTLLTADINSNYWETDVSISTDRKTMFFASDRPGGEGKRDLWAMKKLPSGDWAEVQNLGKVINTQYNEAAPYLHPDGKTLYFSSDGHNTMGGYDVFSSELNEDGTWGTPKNIGFPINTTGDDVFYFPTNDGQRAYFSSYRGGGKGDQDIYILKLPSNEEKTLAIYKGDALYEDGSVIEDLVITVYDDETGEELGVYRPNSTTGRFLFILQPGQSYEIEFDSGGVLATDNVDVPTEGGVQEITKLIVKEGDSLFVKTATISDDDIISLVEEENPDNLVVKDLDIGATKPKVEDSSELIVETPIVDTPIEDTSITENSVVNVTENVISYPNQNSMLKDLYFKYDKVILVDQSEIDYDKALSYLETHTDTKVMIEGHTDSHGSDTYNLWLSSARSNKIRNRLYENGIAWGRMDTRGYGEDKPIAPNKNADGTDNPEGRLLNRRVSFVLDEPATSSISGDSVSSLAEKKPLDNYTQEYEEATVSLSDEVVCMIQLGAFSDPLNNERFTEEPLEVAYYKDKDGLYKYLSGVFVNKDVALEHRLRMIDTGYEGAFVVYFKDGKRLNDEEIALLYPSEEGIELIETTVDNN